MRLFAAVVATVAAFDPAEALWSKFKQDYQKKYEHDEEAHRVKIFRENLAKITQRNAEQKNYVLEINEFADLTQEEFAAQRLGVKMPLKQHKASLGTHEYSGNALPASVDWTTKGAVTPVKNQGQCGSCWSFSTTGALEGANFLATGKLVSLSEEEFVSCDKVDQGCNGGLMDNAFKFAEQNSICTEASYPYTATGGVCKESSCTVGLAKGAVTGFKDVAQNEQALMEAVAQQPVAIAIEADQMAFQFYTSGVLTGACGTNLDHGVLAVGYGTENGQDYWLVKNSWGASWGDKGYIKIERGAKQAGGECGILMSASYPVIAKSEEAAPANGHYEKPPCGSDEAQAQLTGSSGVLCAPKCGLLGTCPKDFPAGVTATPKCALQDQSGGKYCALLCTSDSQCDTAGGSTCSMVQGSTGVCTYPATSKMVQVTLGDNFVV